MIILHNIIKHNKLGKSTIDITRGLKENYSPKGGVFMPRKQAIFKVIFKAWAQKGQNEALIAKFTEIAK